MLFNDSSDSLGTKTLPKRDSSGQTPSFSPECPADGDSERTSLRAFGRITDPKRMISDVSFFGDSDAETDGGVRGFQRTLAIIKPDAVRLMYKIECVMEQNGFIVIMKDVLRLTREQAAEFYGELELELDYPQLIDHMSGKPIAVYVLSKKNCVDEWRRLIGPADVRVARRDFPVSLRAIYGGKTAAGRVANAFHGSDSLAAAVKEISFFFPNSIVEITDDVVGYIQRVMMPTIAEGLSEMNKVAPIDPLRWFGNWLLTKNLPTDNKVTYKSK